MAQMIVRNIDETTARRFKEKAKAEGKSAEQALRDLIGDYVGEWSAAIEELDTIRRSTVGRPVVDPVEVIREDRETDHGRG